MAVKPIPDGYTSVTPYFVVKNCPAFIEFIKNAFGAVEIYSMQDNEGVIRHAEYKIGNAIIMMAEACDGYEPTSSLIYLYVEDVDAVYAQALKAGAESEKEPMDQFYGDRSCSVKDNFGNRWGIATHVKDVDFANMEMPQQSASS